MMIKYIKILLFLIFYSSSLLSMVLQTDSHTYIVGKNDNAILAIDRKTGHEQRIQVGRYPTHMVLHGEFGYVVNNCSNTVSIIDLKTQVVVNTIEVTNYPEFMMIYKSIGYIGGRNDVQLFNLKTHQVLQKVTVGLYPQSMVIHKNVGFVVNYGSESVSVLNLETNKEIQVINVGIHPQSMVIYKDVGYVVNKSSNSISLVDLTTLKHKSILKVGLAPLSMLIHEHYGYVVNMGQNSVSVVNLDKNEVIKDISVGSSPQFISSHGNLGYVHNYHSSDVSVLNFKTNTVIRTIKNPRNDKIGFSDHFLYLGFRKAATLFQTSNELLDYLSLKEFDSNSSRAPYEDPLSPQDIYVLLSDLEFELAWCMLLSLYQPVKFLETSEGQLFFFFYSM